MIATRPGALGIERSHVYPTAALVNALQQRARIPLLVAGDFERGTAMRLEEGTSFPWAMAVAAGGRPEDAYTLGRITALEARAAGIPWIYAPVSTSIAIRRIRSSTFARSAKTRSRSSRLQPRSYAASRKTAGSQLQNISQAMAILIWIRTSVCLLLMQIAQDSMSRVRTVPCRNQGRRQLNHDRPSRRTRPEPDAQIPATLSKQITTKVLRQEMGFNGLS